MKKLRHQRLSSFLIACSYCDYHYYLSNQIIIELKTNQGWRKETEKREREERQNGGKEGRKWEGEEERVEEGKKNEEIQ